MNWIELLDEEGLQLINKKSLTKPQVIFKHSTTCSISQMIKGRLDRSLEQDSIDFNYLDLLHHRNISNKIAEDYNVQHESPQILIIKNGECVYDESHNAIVMEDILEAAV